MTGTGVGQPFSSQQYYFALAITGNCIYILFSKTINETANEPQILFEMTETVRVETITLGDELPRDSRKRPPHLPRQ